MHASCDIGFHSAKIEIFQLFGPKTKSKMMNCRTLLAVAPPVVGVERQRKGKEVKRRGEENHV